MANRPKSCGPCGMCCKVFAVDELAKPMGVMCAHYGGAAAGCTIHPDRPHACRTFECVWLMDPEMPHRFRPDQTKVVLDQDPDGTRLIARCDPANPQAWRRNPMYASLKGYAAQTWGTGKLVLAVAGRHTWVIAPNEDIDVGEIDPGQGLRVIETNGRIAVSVLPEDPH